MLVFAGRAKVYIAVQAEKGASVLAFIAFTQGIYHHTIRAKGQMAFVPVTMLYSTAIAEPLVAFRAVYFSLFWVIMNGTCEIAAKIMIFPAKYISY